MPLYDYKCKVCGFINNVRHPMDLSPLVSCNKCGQETFRMISGSAVIFKGNGFYSTDNKKGE